MKKAYPLSELTEHLKRVVALNFPETVWVLAEISQLSYSKGHCYLDLIQKGDFDQVVAQSRAAIWERQLKKLTRQYTSILPAVLQSGVEVKLNVKVDYSERYGITLIVEDIDTEYTVGQWAIKRQATLLRLQREGLQLRQRQLLMPKVLQRIAIISSSTAAGLQDFMVQLLQNQYGYVFEMTLFEAAMQGIHSASEVVRQLQSIDPFEYDCVVIVRGGGAKIDLSSFDEYEVARAIALTKLPVLTGIGHDIDESVSDMVSFASLKTPTATAEYIISHNADFETEMLYLEQFIQQYVSQRFDYEHHKLDLLQNTYIILGQSFLQKAEDQLQYLSMQLQQSTQQTLAAQVQLLDNFAQILVAHDPQTILKKGYSITTLNGKAVSAKELKKGDILQTQFFDGEIASVVK
jgi:exodeoxyribonuclease VII large subunit